MRLSQLIIAVLLVIHLSSCTNSCPPGDLDVYRPRLSGEAAEWVSLRDSTPRFAIAYKDENGNITSRDTLICKYDFRVDTPIKPSEDGCKSIHYQYFNIILNIPYKFYFEGFELETYRSDCIFRGILGNIYSFTDKTALDTATIDGHTYQHVYKLKLTGGGVVKDAYYARGVGFIYLNYRELTGKIIYESDSL